MTFPMSIKFLSTSLIIILVANFSLGCNMFGSLKPKTGPEEFFEQVSDVVSGKRDLQLKGNILTGEAQISTSYTTEEIMQMVAIGGGILLAIVCIGVCSKHCCCKRATQPTVILYQQMQSEHPQRYPQCPNVIQSGGTAVNNIPMYNQGISRAHSQYPGIHISSPPPPYPSTA